MSKRTNHLPPALKHGIYSGIGLLPGEDPAAFEKLKRELFDEFAPVGRSEEDIVDYLARLKWRSHNLRTYRLAELACARHSAIYADLGPPPVKWRYALPIEVEPETRSPEELRALRKMTDEEAQTELGTVGIELVEIGHVATINCLEEELSIRERLDAMIDRCYKRLLYVRGIKSMPSSSAVPVSQTRRLTKAA